MRRHWIVLVPLVLALAGCGGTATGTEKSLLAEHGLTGLGAVQIVDELDRLPVDERPEDLMASVRPDELLLSDGSDEVAVDMPADRFYLSVAPYVEDTHDCFHHSLTTCTGELGGAEVDVRITSADGEVLVDRSAATFDNGFIGFWLPRDIEGTVTVTYGGRTGSADFATDADSPTCVTTLRLA